MGRKKNSSDFLKECIADALFILLRTKSIESITVREITELANVSRITYYRNFTSKENVIEFKLDKLMTEWIEKQPQKESASAHELSIRFFQFFYSIRDIVQTLIRANLSLLLLNRLILNSTISIPQTAANTTVRFLFLLVCAASFSHGWTPE